MLTPLGSVYVYVVKYDLGFAPNPYHGACTLACCKPVIRRTARVADWIVGVGGRALRATGRCIFAMQVTDAMTFEDYWQSHRFRAKRPRRNGSRVAMVGDNVYRRAPGSGTWAQEDCVHSQPGGAQDEANTAHDTATDRILVSERFFYFGDAAPAFPVGMMSALPYTNGRGHRVYPRDRCDALLGWVADQAGGVANRVMGDPIQLRLGDRRYSISKDRLL